MTYTIKCIAGIHSIEGFEIKGGQEKNVSKEIYDYFNNRFGPSGNFNFISKESVKKAPEKKEVEDVKVEDEVVEVKVEKKARRAKK